MKKRKDSKSLLEFKKTTVVVLSNYHKKNIQAGLSSDDVTKSSRVCSVQGEE